MFRLLRSQVCACSNKQTVDFDFISPSCTLHQCIMPNEILLFTYRFPQTSQQNQKTISTKSRQGTYFKVQIRIKFLTRHSGEKKVIFQIFCSPKAKSSRNWRPGERYLNPCMLPTHVATLVVHSH